MGANCRPCNARTASAGRVQFVVTAPGGGDCLILDGDGSCKLFESVGQALTAAGYEGLASGSYEILPR